MRGKIAAGVALALAATISIEQTHHRGDAAPYSAGSIGAALHLQVVPVAQAQARLDALAGAGRLTAAPSGNASVLVGQVTFATPHTDASAGQYALFVIDNGEHRSVPTMVGVGPVGSNVSQGWDSRYAKFGSGGAAVSFPPSTRGPITFEAVADPGAAPITDLGTQVTVSLAYYAVDGHLYWSETLPS